MDNSPEQIQRVYSEINNASLEVVQLGNLELNVYNAYPADKIAVDAINEAISLVYRRYLRDPAKFQIFHTSYLVDGKDVSKLSAFSAQYSSKLRNFNFAHEQIKKTFSKLKLPHEAICFLLAAHEARHAVDACRGNSLPSTDDLSQEEYAKDPFEEAAWREAVDVFKLKYPKARGSITIFGTTYVVPEESTYRSLSEAED